MTTRKAAKKNRNTTEKRLLAGCVLLAVSALLTVLSGEMPQMAEWYSTHIYPVLVSTIGRFSGQFPYSLSELVLYVIVILLAGTFLRAVILIIRFKRGGTVMLRWASGLFLTAAVLFFLYVANCGINYHRISFSEKSQIQTSQYTAEDLKKTCTWLTNEVNIRAGRITRNDLGEMELTCNEGSEAVAAMTQLGKTYSSLNGYYPRPKPLICSQFLSYQNLTGIYLPFTVEANYNQDMPDYNIPFTVCHELSHLRGFMQEEEANFIAFLACKDAQQEDFQYSGYLLGWVYSMNALHKADAQAWEEVRAALDESIEADLLANNQFWAGYDGAVAEVSNKVNDTYLKANGQTDGVQSYDRMVDLIVAYYKGI